jgi:LuxR family transcriptional regulator, maltose regulon positive regulatory protein
MAGPLLETKLQAPRRRRDLVARPRLSERLSRGAESELTLISAPAGFGKTTLLADWLADTASSGGSAAWLSLDQRDNDPALFWTYVVTAVKTAYEVGADALTLLQSQQSIETVIASLLNDLQTVSNDVVLVLDDYHLIDARDVQEEMAFLLEHLPQHVHVVIAGRADPPLPLAGLRGRGELVEIRAADLRFTADEAATYLNGAMGLALTAQDVATLEGRTEGWIAALQLAALSMRGRDDVAGFIAGFAGDDRYIVDYLAEEVLQRQPEQIRHFLLQTSVLERLSGPLCDAVTGQNGGKAKLAALEQGNLFVVPLDDRRQWYRYHQLFADVLHAHLLDEQPDDIPELHRRASIWYEQNGDQFEAIDHALAAQDVERAADLIELAMPALRRDRREATLRSWLNVIPDELVRVRPVLNIGFVGALVSGGELTGIEGRLRDAERWLDTGTASGTGSEPPSGGMVVRDLEELPRLPGTIEMYRAALALVAGDLPGTVMHAKRAIDLSPEDDQLPRAGAAGLIGLASWGSGDLEAGHRAYAECMAGLRRAGHIADTFGCALALADIRIAQGRLDDAMRTYDGALQQAAEHGRPVLRGTADMYLGMSQVHRERNDLSAATRCLQQSQELGEHLGLPQNSYRWRVALARVREAEGDLDGALELLDEAERRYVSDFFPNVRPISAMRTRVWIRQGRLGEALGWARERRLSAEDDLSYLREFEHITLARTLLAQYAGAEHEARFLDEATKLLERLLQAAEEGARTGSVTEILVLQALASQMRGASPAAVASLQRALKLSEPEGYVRIFVDEDRPMATLLRAAVRQGIAPSYARRLLAAVDKTQEQAPIQRGLIESLSERELDVLRLLGSDLDGPDIARELVVSLNTVRSHTKNIYAKLGVNNRRAAVRRAQELNLMSRKRDARRP